MTRWFWRQPQETRIRWTVRMVNTVLAIALVAFALR